VRDILRAVKDGDSAEHVAQRARDQKARQQAHNQAVAALVEAGVTIIDRPGYDDKTIKELREIRLVKRNATVRGLVAGPLRTHPRATRTEACRAGRRCRAPAARGRRGSGS